MTHNDVMVTKNGKVSQICSASSHVITTRPYRPIKRCGCFHFINFYFLQRNFFMSLYISYMSNLWKKSLDFHQSCFTFNSTQIFINLRRRARKTRKRAKAELSAGGVPKGEKQDNESIHRRVPVIKCTRVSYSRKSRPTGLCVSFLEDYAVVGVCQAIPKFPVSRCNKHLGTIKASDPRQQSSLKIKKQVFQSRQPQSLRFSASTG